MFIMKFKKGDVILVRFPNSDFKTYKKRPTITVQSDELITELPQKIVVPITSNLNRTGRTRIRINQDSSIGQQMGLRLDSVIFVDNLATILEREIDQKIGDGPIMDQVNEALRLVFD